MATPRSQRVGIWIIAIVLTIGTLGSFLAMILGNQNTASQQAKMQQESAKYTAAYNAQTKQLSDKYYAQLNKYANAPVPFEASSVKKLATTDLEIGNGTELKSGTAYSAYYIGWNPKGKIFQQSIANGSLDAPIAGGNMIEGWNEGVIGMKMGGIRELSIPSDKAYKNVAQSEDIPANTPLKFIVMAIPKVTDIPMSAELLQYYQSQQAGTQQ